MTTISYVEACADLASMWDRIVATRETMIISRRGKESLVVMPLGEWKSIEETLYLLRSPANASRLLSALDRLNQGEGESLTMEELQIRVGLK